MMPAMSDITLHCQPAYRIGSRQRTRLGEVKSFLEQIRHETEYGDESPQSRTDNVEADNVQIRHARLIAILRNVEGSTMRVSSVYSSTERDCESNALEGV